MADLAARGDKTMALRDAVASEYIARNPLSFSVMGEWDDARISRRLNVINLIYEKCPYLCWSELVMWAMFDRPVSVTGAEDCRTREEPVCYCGRFINGVENDPVS